MTPHPHCPSTLSIKPLNKWCLLFAFVFICSIVTSAQTITTIAGGATGHGGYWGEGGLATDAQLSSAAFVAVSKQGTIYIADKERVLEVQAQSGLITTLAGTGTLGYNGDGIPATNAQLNWAGTVSYDENTNSVLIGDGENYRIRQVVISSGIISTLVGNGMNESNGDGGLSTAASTVGGGISSDDDGNIYFGCRRKIRKVNSVGIVSTVAGTGSVGVIGEGVVATSTCIGNYALGVATDKWGNVYFSDSSRAVRKITVSTGIITRVAGTGDNIGSPFSGDNIPATSCHISPLGIAVDDTGNLYIADAGNNRVYKVDTYGIIRTIAGTGISGYSGDGGNAEEALLANPQAVALDKCGNVFIADFTNKRVRKIYYRSCDYTDVPQITADAPLFHPNPATNHLSITYAAGLQSVTITDMLGRTVLHQSLTGQHTAELPLQLSPGCYTIIINQTPPQKLIIQ